MGPSPASLLPTTPITIDGSTRSDDPVMQISGARHWFLKGWIGDHSVEFVVDSGSSVTAMSNSFYQTLVHAGAPLGVLEDTVRTLRSANGTGIEVSGCSHCVVSFMGLQTEFPIIIFRPSLGRVVCMDWARCWVLPDNCLGRTVFTTVTSTLCCGSVVWLYYRDQSTWICPYA